MCKHEFLVRASLGNDLVAVARNVSALDTHVCLAGLAAALALCAESRGEVVAARAALGTARGGEGV